MLKWLISNFLARFAGLAAVSVKDSALFDLFSGLARREAWYFSAQAFTWCCFFKLVDVVSFLWQLMSELGACVWMCVCCFFFLKRRRIMWFGRWRWLFCFSIWLSHYALGGPHKIISSETRYSCNLLAEPLLEIGFSWSWNSNNWYTCKHEPDNLVGLASLA